MKLIFDTSAWIEYFKGTLQGKIVQEYLASVEVITPVVVLLELSYRAEKERWDFAKHLSFIKMNSLVVGVHDAQLLSFGALYNAMKAKMKDFGFVDVLILSTAHQAGAGVLTKDSHFAGLKETIFLK